MVGVGRGGRVDIRQDQKTILVLVELPPLLLFSTGQETIVIGGSPSGEGCKDFTRFPCNIVNILWI